ncbi:MAG: saccharopine dehydrogenase NADP-binding domain-containing protein, partial [Myxococcota bacterium]
MKYRYVVLGAGRQGVAAAYDLLKHGDAREVVIADSDEGRAREAVATLARLGGPGVTGRAVARTVDGADEKSLADVLTGADAALSAIPYYLNVKVTRAAIAARASLCDLGGNTDVVREQIAL